MPGGGGDYRETAWFNAAEGDIVFFQWFLDRCFELCDVSTTESGNVAQKIYKWFSLRQALRLELGLTTSEIDTEQEADNSPWTTEKIVDEVGGALQILRQELEATDSKLKREVVAEVLQICS